MRMEFTLGEILDRGGEMSRRLESYLKELAVDRWEANEGEYGSRFRRWPQDPSHRPALDSYLEDDHTFVVEIG